MEVLSTQGRRLHATREALPGAESEAHPATPSARLLHVGADALPMAGLTVWRDPSHPVAGLEFAAADPASPVLGKMRALLRLEGLVVLALSVAAYSNWGIGWMAFAGFFLVPDLSMLGYSWGPRVGAAVYNAGHSYIGPIALLAAGLFAAMPLATALALIWTAHIGFDRALGFGLKSASGFRYTHLGTLGRPDAW
ncbi:MAG: DUF4260 domain-containing protein [Pseudomonadota bacterium]